MTITESLSLAVRALRRHVLRSCLTLLGVTIGVGAVLTMVAVGNGARASIEDQVTAAGLNVITVTAGNYRMKGEDGGDVGADHASLWPEPMPHTTGPRGASAAVPDHVVAHVGQPRLEPAVYEVGRAVFRLVGHPEDDPTEKHNHPTARQRLGDAAAGLGAAATLTRDDAAAVRREIRGVHYVAGAVHESARIVVDGRRWFTRLHGTEPDIAHIRRAWTFTHGAFFSGSQAERGDQVVVLGSVVVEKLFGRGVNPVGTRVAIWNQAFTVVGVVAGTSWTSTGAVGDDQFDAVYVPVATVHRLLNLSKLNTITLTARSSGETTRVSKDVTELLRKRHGIAESMADDFVVRTQANVQLGKGLNQQVARAIAGNVPELEAITLDQLSTTLERSSRTMTALLASIAGVSLLVGGIGIMNIMLLSVTERTREIGLRMALGARGRDVLMQFLAEAVTLSVLGGAIGVVVSVIASGTVKSVLGWATEVSPGAVALALGVAAAVGVFFGLYPAKQASQLDPIDALRFE